MKVGDKVFVIDWGKHYSKITKWNQETQTNDNIFSIKTVLPNYCGINHFWDFIYEPNLTLKGTVNKREPKKLVEKIPVYKHFKCEILEIFKHPKAGEYYYSEEDRVRWGEGKYSEDNLLLLASTHKEQPWMKCYIIISELGVSTLTPEQYANDKFNAFIEGNLGKWDRNNIKKDSIPKEIISTFYDENDNVLFGSQMAKGLVSYSYLEGKYSVDGKHIYIGNCVVYGGGGNSECPNPELIKPFKYIKEYIEGNNT
jgi:hypothetical protein